MFSKFNLLELLTDGFSDIRIGKSKFVSLIIHLLIPLLLAVTCIKFNIRFDNDIISSIISSISIFSGLLFSVIFILLQNYSARRKTNRGKLDEEVINYLERYKNFTRQVSTLILFSIAIALKSIVLLLIYMLVFKAKFADESSLFQLIHEQLLFFYDGNTSSKNLLLNTIQIISSILLFNYLLTIFVLVKEVYAMIYDDINSKY